jgi:hypothetical protein
LLERSGTGSRRGSGDHGRPRGRQETATIHGRILR